MSNDFNVNHISYRFYCDKLVSMDLSNNLIIESSNNNIEFKSANQTISFNNNSVFNYGLTLNNRDLSNIINIAGNTLNIDTLFVTDISNSQATIVDYNSINYGYIRATTIGYNPSILNDISGRSDAYFTYINVSGGDSSFNNSVYIKNILGVSGATTISNDLIVNGTSYVTLYNAINNYIANIKEELSSNKILTLDLSATNISVSNELVVNKTSFLNNISIYGQLLDNVLKVPHDFTIDPSGHDNASGTLIINGDLIVYGNRTTINSNIIEISDITLSVATNLMNANDLYNNNAGLDISNVASIKYDGTNWNFIGGQLTVENKKVSLDVSLVALTTSSITSLNSLNSYFDLSYRQLKNNLDNSYNATYNRNQIDASFLLKSDFDISLLSFNNDLDISYVNLLTFDASFSALKTYLDASYILKSTSTNINSIDNSLNFLRDKLDLSYVLKSTFEGSYNSLKDQIDISFGSIRLTSLDTSTISVDTINTKHFTQRFANILWNQIGLDISNGPPLTNNNKKIAISNDGKVVALSSSSHSDISKGRVYVYELTYNQASYSWTRLGLSSEIIVGLSNDDQFGWDIALSSNGRVVAGSSIVSDASGINCGQVRLFELSNNNVWRQKGLNINGPRAASESGYSISLAGNGNTIAIGAWKDNSNGTNAGAVRVYDFSANVNDWRQQGQTIAGVSGSFEGYSTALSLDGATLATGCFSVNNSNNIINAGQVKTFTISGSSWVSKGTIQGPDISNLYFGRAIKLSDNGNVIVIGAPGYNIPPVTNSTSSSSFAISATSLTRDQHITTAASVPGRTLGSILNVSEKETVRLIMQANTSDVYIGARRRATSLNATGRTSLDWEWVSGDIWDYQNFQAGDPNNLSYTALIMWGWGGAGDWYNATGNAVMKAIYKTTTVTTTTITSSIPNVGQAYVYSYVGGTTWTQIGQAIQGISGGDEFGSNVSTSNDGSTIVVGGRFSADNNSRCNIRVFKNNNNSWIQLGQTFNGLVNNSILAYNHAFSGDGATLIHNLGNQSSRVYGINKTLVLNAPMTTISGNLIVLGNISANSLDISINHSYSSNGYSYKIFESPLSSAIMKEYYSDVTSTRHLKVQITGNGYITNRNNSYKAISDSRLKENIQDSGPKLEDLLKVRVVNYNLKGSDPTKYIGVLAQELEDVFPNLVTELEPSPKDIQDGNTIKYKAVNYSSFDVLLIKALQEQNAILKNIEKRIVALEDELDDN